MKNAVTKAVRKIKNNPKVAKDLMSKGSYQHLKNNTNLAPASFGKAVERLAARIISGTKKLAGNKIRHTGRLRGPDGRFVSSPDFTAVTPNNTITFDVTTKAKIPSHVARYTGNNTQMPVFLPYTRPSGVKFK